MRTLSGVQKIILKIQEASRTRATLSVAVLALGGLISRVLGLVRDRLLAHTYGASEIVDIYVAAFRTPDFIFQSLMLGAFAAAAVPVLIAERESHGNRGVITLSNMLLTRIVFTMSLTTIIVAFFTPSIVGYFFSHTSPEGKILLIDLTRIMLITVPLFTASSVANAILASSRRFWSASWQPVVYNIGILLGIVIANSTSEPRWLGVGVVIGACAHVTITYPELKRMGWKLSPSSFFTWSARATSVLGLMLPRSFSLVSQQISLTIIISIIGTWGIGSISAYYFAHNVMSVPLGLIGISLSTVALPALTTAYHQQGNEGIGKALTRYLSIAGFLIGPLIWLLIVLRAQVVRLFLGSGNFDWNATYQTAQILGIVAIGLLPAVISPLLIKSFFARENTRIPLLVSLVILPLSVGGAILGNTYGGLYGTVSMVSIISWIEFLLLLRMYEKYTGSLMPALLRMSTDVFFSGFIAGVGAWGALRVANVFVSITTVPGLVLQTSTAIVTAGVIYLFVQSWIGHPAMEIVSRYARALQRSLKKTFAI